MPTMAVNNMAGEKVGEIETSVAWFATPVHHDLIYQALATVDRSLKRYAGRTQTRAEVDRTKSKWYRQKGTGRARHGNRAAPIFVGGGKAHGPKGEARQVKMPKKMRHKALCSALSAQVGSGRVAIVDRIDLEQIRTKTVVAMLSALGCQGKVLVLLSEDEYLDQYIYLSCRNVPGLAMREAPHFSVRDALWADHILITRQALAAMGVGGEANADL